MKPASCPPEVNETVGGERVSCERRPYLRGYVGATNGPFDGYVLSCGRIRLWSVPLDFIFTPNTHRLTHVVTVNAEIFSLAHQDAKLAQILSTSVNTIDGRVLQGLCKLLYPAYRVVRQNGSNFVLDLADHCVRFSERLFLLGSKEDVNARAVQCMKSTFPGLQVAGFSPSFQTYPFEESWNAAILKRLESFRPHHLIVCFGPKKQEYWIDHNSSRLTELGVRCAYGLGGTIDFLSGAKPRAPKWIEFIGAEWLFRVACEPKARFRRTLTMFKMPLFVARTVRGANPLIRNPNGSLT